MDSKSETENGVAYYVSGSPEGEPLVLSSSLGTTSRMWQEQLTALEARHLVIRYDHRGHGRSAAPRGAYSLGDLGNDVIEILDSEGLGRVHFAGLSLGGMVGIWLAENAPGRVERLALLCTYAEASSPELWGDRAKSVRALGTASVVEGSIERWFTDSFRNENPARMEEFATDLAQVADDGYAGCCEAIQTMDLAPGLGKIEAPTLVIAGNQDVAAPPETMRSLAKSIPDANYVEVEAAHLANVEQSVRVSELLAGHFR